MTTDANSAFGANEWLVDELYEQYLQDRHSVDPAWWDFFADYVPSDPARAAALKSKIAGVRATVTSPTYGHPAGEWHHITATWSLSSGTLALYVDGTLAASSTTALSGLLGTLSTLYIGSQRMAGISGTPAAYTANSANGYIDEVRLYSSALSALEIEGIPAYTHTCAASIHHYELSLPSSAVSCLASSVTVAACADASSPCTNRSTGAANHTVTLLPAGAALGATTLSFDATGTTTTTMSNAAALDGATATVTLLSAELLASAAAQCCPNGSSCTASPSCSTTYKTAGLVIAAANGGAATTVGTQTAGSASAAASCATTRRSRHR